jgi:acetoin utilization protein AcuB
MIAQLNRMIPMRVAEVMSVSLLTVDGDTVVAEALRLAQVRGVKVVVVSNEDRLLGQVSIRELEEAPPGAFVRDVMQAPVRTVSASASLDEASKLMERHNTSGLLVLAGGVPVGLVTLDELAADGQSITSK